MGVERGGDLEKGGEQRVVLSVGVMFAAKILHRTSPVDIGQQALVTQAQAFQNLGRGDVEDFLERGALAKLVQTAEQKHGGQQANRQQQAGDQGNAPR